MRMFPPSTPSKSAGFSLLEMLIVLTIMGLMLSLMGARSLTAIEATRFINTANAGIGSIKILRAEAVLNNTPIRIINSSTNIQSRQEKHLDLPQGWQVSGDIIQISKAGMCQGGYITLQGPTNRRATFALSPPKCEPVRITNQ